MQIERSGGTLTRVLALVSGFGRRGRAGDGTGSMRVELMPSLASWDDEPPFRSVPCNDGQWPEDPNEIPDWMARSIAWHQERGLRPLGYRTRAEFDALVAKIAAAEELDELASRTAPKPKLSPDEAAIDFVRALRAAERTGQYLSDDLTAAYLDHCTATNRRPTAENLLRAALKFIKGVRVEKINIEGPKRHRPTVWIIEPDEAMEDVENDSEMLMAA